MALVHKHLRYTIQAVLNRRYKAGKKNRQALDHWHQPNGPGNFSRKGPAIVRLFPAANNRNYPDHATAAAWCREQSIQRWVQ